MFHSVHHTVFDYDFQTGLIRRVIVYVSWHKQAFLRNI